MNLRVRNSRTWATALMRFTRPFRPRTFDADLTSGNCSELKAVRKNRDVSPNVHLVYINRSASLSQKRHVSTAGVSAKNYPRLNEGQMGNLCHCRTTLLLNQIIFWPYEQLNGHV